MPEILTLVKISIIWLIHLNWSAAWHSHARIHFIGNWREFNNTAEKNAELQVQSKNEKNVAVAHTLIIRVKCARDWIYGRKAIERIATGSKRQIELKFECMCPLFNVPIPMRISNKLHYNIKRNSTTFPTNLFIYDCVSLFVNTLFFNRIAFKGEVTWQKIHDEIFNTKKTWKLATTTGGWWF